MDENGNLCTHEGTWSTVPSGSASFSYDAVGNRTDQSGAYGSANRIRQFAGCTYVTDSLGDGNVLSRTCGSEVVRFWWTAESRLAALKVVGGDTLDFRYDASGRLVRKDAGGAAQTYFLWQGDNLLAELTSAATGKVAEYSYYPGLDNPHAVITDSVHFAHVDGIGNVIALTDSAKNVKRSYDFDAWGGLRGGTDYKPFSNADRARFKGALWLGPQVDLYYMRARWYEPKSGRFLSEDPIGLDGGINLYSLAGNDPINGRDPTGTCAEGEELWMIFLDHDRDGVYSTGDTIIGYFCQGGGGGGRRERSARQGNQQPQQQQQPQCPLTLPPLVRQAGENAYWRSVFTNSEQVTAVVNNSTILPVVPTLSTQMRARFYVPAGTTALTHGHLKLGPNDYTYGSVSPADMNQAKTRGFPWYAFSADSISVAFPDSTRVTCFDERIAPWGVP